MTKNQKEVINISLLNKNINLDEKSKINDNSNNKNNTINLSEDKKDKSKNNKEILPKIFLKKETNNTNNNMLNQKRERTQSNNKDIEENQNNNIGEKNSNNSANNLNKKKTSLSDAKKEMKDFELLILNTEKEIQKKYGFIFPDLSYEDNLPDDIKNKLIDDFLDSPRIQKLLNEATAKK